jgi:hypothetical protein
VHLTGSASCRRLGNAERSLAELIGVAVLLSLAHQWQLYRWPALRALLATGRIGPTIDFTGST